MNRFESCASRNGCSRLGIAFIQVRYHTAAAWRARGHKCKYRRNLANMTTFEIDEIWLRAPNADLRHGSSFRCQRIG
jgi:hypothetical protein